jgi:hypothetical protein
MDDNGRNVNAPLLATFVQDLSELVVTKALFQ